MSRCQPRDLLSTVALDSVEKIEFPKMARITQLVYATGLRLANLDHAPVRDNKGPRKGKGASIEKRAGHLHGAPALFRVVPAFTTYCLTSCARTAPPGLRAVCTLK